MQINKGRLACVAVGYGVGEKNDSGSSPQVTGLYAESHGIVSSDMYDPVSHKHFTLANDTDPMWWSQAEPLWVTARRYGYKTATAMWPGSDAVNRTGTHFLPYNHRVTFRERLGRLLGWIRGSEEVKKKKKDGTEELSPLLLMP